MKWKYYEAIRRMNKELFKQIGILIIIYLVSYFFFYMLSLVIPFVLSLEYIP